MMFEFSLANGCPSMPASPADKSRILIVDDEPPNQLILEDLLEQQFDVHTTSNSHQALEYLKTGNPVDLILMDKSTHRNSPSD
jgi:CheY-like chemotaxis protein